MKLLLAKIVSAVDDADEAFKLECEGKYINSIAWCPGGFVFHDSITDAAIEELDQKLKFKWYDLNDQPKIVQSTMTRKHMYGFKEIEFIEVESNDL